MKAMWLVGLGALMAAMPAGADVKAGVDAWAKGDFNKAVAEWRGPAIAGDADAQFNMGQAYKLGRGVPVDPAMAKSWFAKAAAQGHAQAIDNYGLMLFQDGDKAEAVPWLEKSVARDEKRAELVLGTMLFNGDGVPKDWTRAYGLVTRSQQQGLSQASQTLAQLDQYVRPEQRQAGIAMARDLEAKGKAYALTPKTPIAPPPGPATATRSGAPYAGPAKAPPPPPPANKPAPVPSKPAPVAAKPNPKPAPSAAKPAPARGGAWRIQLGAFRDEGNARSLWAKVGSRTGGSPAYVKAGAVTRLQATGFASRADAQRACAKAGGGCVVIAP